MAKSFIAVLLTSLALVFSPTTSTPKRLVFHRTYADLFKDSDLVVIASRADARDATEADKLEPGKEEHRWCKDFLPVLSTFNVGHVLKGEHQPKEIVLVHYRTNERSPVVSHDLMLVTFPNAAREWKYPPSIFRPQDQYMLFLKKRKDGRFACVTGQIDPFQSVITLSPAQIEGMPRFVGGKALES